MKKLLCLFSVLLFSISCTKAQKQFFTPQALSSTLITENNSKITFQEILKNNQGKPIVLEVWASWCGDCVKNMPNIKQLQKNYPVANFVFLSCDKNEEDWKAGVEKHELVGKNYLIPDGMKGSFAKEIDVNWIPRYIIIDKNGKIVLYNAIETDYVAVNELLKKLTNEN